MDGGLHSNNFPITERCGDAARGGGRWCYTPAGIPPGPQVIINDHPEMPNMELASTHFWQSHDAQYGTRVDALSVFTNDHSTMTKWPAWYSNIRIRRWGTKPEMDPRYRGYITRRRTRESHPDRQSKHAKDTDAGT